MANTLVLNSNQRKQRYRMKDVLIDVPVGSSVDRELGLKFIEELESASKELENSVSERFINPDPVAWIDEHFRIPETEDHKMPLDAYQIACLRRIFRKNENGLWDYSIIVWSDLKKSAKCLDFDTELILTNGERKKAIDIQIGDEVYGRNLSKNKVIAREIQKPEKVYKIFTNRGREIITTGKHPFLINKSNHYPSQGKHFKDNIEKETWINAEDLKVGYGIVVEKGWAKEKDYEENLECYLLGAYVGDGGQGVITSSEYEIINEFSRKFSLSERGKYSYHINGACDWFRENGLLKGGSNHKNFSNSYTVRVPKKIFNSDFNGIIEFISGYFDTDGFISKFGARRPALGFCSVNKELLRDCQYLLASIGINANLKRHDSSFNGKKFEAYKLLIQDRRQIVTLAKILRSRILYKRERLNDWLNFLEDKINYEAFELFSSDRIVSINILPERETIAIEVDNDHTHITNGLVTHNSTVAAAVALWFAFQLKWGSIKIVANDLKQADSRVSYYIRRCIELNPELKEVCHVVPSGYHITLPNHTVIEAIPVDPKGEAGGNDDGIFYSELWAANNEASKRLWSETTLAPLKYGRSFRWVETYAGFSGESETLENLYMQGVKEGIKLDFSSDFDPELEVYENPNARMFCLWNTTPRRAWQTQEYYSQESAILKPNEFQRIHRNQWVTSESIFVPMEWWDACKDMNMPNFDANTPMILAADAGVSNDYFGIVGVSGYDDGTHYGVRYVGVWKPPKIGVEIDYALPEAEIRRLIDNYNIIEINYDPYQLVDMSQRLRKELVVRMRKFTQESERTLSDTLLYQKIMNRTIHHQGEAELKEHINNANSTAASKERIRIIKRSQVLKIDLAVCLSMALSRAVYWRL